MSDFTICPTAFGRGEKNCTKNTLCTVKGFKLSYHRSQSIWVATRKCHWRPHFASFLLQMQKEERPWKKLRNIMRSWFWQQGLMSSSILLWLQSFSQRFSDIRIEYVPDYCTRDIAIQSWVENIFCSQYQSMNESGNVTDMNRIPDYPL